MHDFRIICFIVWLFLPTLQSYQSSSFSHEEGACSKIQCVFIVRMHRNVINCTHSGFAHCEICALCTVNVSRFIVRVTFPSFSIPCRTVAACRSQISSIGQKSTRKDETRGLSWFSLHSDWIKCFFRARTSWCRLHKRKRAGYYYDELKLTTSCITCITEGQDVAGNSETQKCLSFCTFRLFTLLHVKNVPLSYHQTHSD